MSELFLGHSLTDASRIAIQRDDLTTHAVVVGRTGSGKTGLVHVLIEEAVMQGASAVVIDPKGDLTNLLLSFPGLTPEEFAPWVAAGKSPVDEAQKWAEGLEATGQDRSRVMEWHQAATFRVFTPGFAGDHSLNLLPSLARPKVVSRERAQHIVNAILSALGLDFDPLTDPRSVFLTDLLMWGWSRGRDLPLDQWPGFLSQPPEELSSFDGIDIAEFFPRKDRMKLASAIVGFRRQAARWLDGPPMDFNSFLMPGNDGRPQVSIFTLRHLSEDDRTLFTSMFLSGLVAWMFQAPASGRLRALCVLDEAAGYLPPHPLNPPTKRPICTLLAQGRAQGLGLLLATQNPNDIDYKALNNVGTWLLGGLGERDTKRDLDSKLRERGVDPSSLFKLPEKTFMLLTKHGQTHKLKVRWTLSYLSGPIETERLSEFSKALPEPVEETRLAPAPSRLPACYGVVTVNFHLVDKVSRPYNATITYSTDGGKTWKRATPDESYRNPTPKLASSPKGVSHDWDWNTVADLGRKFYRGVLVHVRTEGGGLTLPAFDVCNNTLDDEEEHFQLG